MVNLVFNSQIFWDISKKINDSLKKANKNWKLKMSIKSPNSRNILRIVLYCMENDKI